MELCRAIAPRLREQNPVIVFKALLVLHTMIRNGQTDNILGYLARHDELHLRNISNIPSDHYDAPRNMNNYSVYLDTRIKAYRELKHDPIRVQAETNRDIRASQALDEPPPAASSRNRRPTSAGNGATSEDAGLQRSKTMAGRKLRVMTVEKGLLRETKIVQRVIDSLLDCSFYVDNLEDDLVICALRLIIKDLLVLFQACNEGVINVLEHYFEMSHVDATAALQIYRHFCKQAERVLDYVAVARKMQNILNIPVPQLRHAPVSLAGALEEYLNDPNFEQNRIEYKTNKSAADRNLLAGNSGIIPKSLQKAPTPPPPVPSLPSAGSPTNGPPSGGPRDMTDFLSSIEAENQHHHQQQQQANGFLAAQAQAGFNPFRQSMLMPQGTGFPGMIPQGTGFPGASPFIAAQPTAMQFQSPSPFAMQPTGAPFIQPQSTAMPSFLNQPPPQLPQQQPLLVPQQTGGANPFRQSMLLPQMTGPAAFNLLANGGQPSSANPAMSPAVPWASSPPPNMPQRPQSTPLTSMTAGPTATVSSAGVITHATGSRNPFGPPPTKEFIPAVPKLPTLQQLATGAFPRAASPPAATNTSMGGPSMISGVASSFARRAGSPTSPSRMAFSTLGSVPETGSITNSLAGLNFGGTSSSVTTSPVQPQATGFGGIKPFKPSSSFGASLVEGLPPAPNGTAASSPGLSTTPFGSIGAQPTGAPFGQFGSMTNGAGSTTPFSLLGGTATGTSTTSSTGSPFPSSLSSATTGSTVATSVTGAPSLSFTSSFGGGLGATTNGMAGAVQPQMTAMPFSSTPSSPFPGGALNSQPGAATPMLRPQTTGGPNPFRASMFVPPSDNTMPQLAYQPTGMRAPFSANPGASVQLPSGGNAASTGMMQTNAFGGAFGGAGAFGQQQTSLFPGAGQQQQQQQQQPQTGSLI
ncbi:ANTH-domain-containing protein [Auriculariales sp. MPI-PUGE-AT-0066]|nr:ANTH-domain-containing protein [Auriculariales sp. MPI-PUGE-AT-0066]